MSFLEIWNEAYNLYSYTESRDAVMEFLKCHVNEGNLTPADAETILEDVKATYEL